MELERTSEKIRNFECPVAFCKKRFMRRYNLKIHMRIHSGETPFVCKVHNCQKRFKWRSGLRNHVRWHRSDELIEEHRSLLSPRETASDCSSTSKDEVEAEVPPPLPLRDNDDVMDPLEMRLDAFTDIDSPGLWELNEKMEELESLYNLIR
mmetsp:Transcript_5615/g.16720  ORF Transcript_5615/g.16720 Transcript_5615/m.16720 type:complete len:151 (-) Transcript_5615:242-694(-)|eukprot:CAMPEP_0198735992 /NCGR_PEP_ID=MMETSP1475-20131203/62888_1 /TAXON_ID= ORGANISM="Unidentified sp., Strain CCMP1999" /NCGR_SAMPLE_ID=MMETSP1475 /ASSEMBLY_ACC=CAM_ASM_001111 /LENGTH=150 /DNA_ID=CAMNT_0044499733 /DNA_START=77 /DNA_END=529 /DNA_ORIENTATION=-